MADSDSPEQLEAYRVLESSVRSLTETGTINDIQYYGLSLKAPGINDTYDPEARRRIFAIAGFWPGGLAGTEQSNLSVGGFAGELSPEEQVQEGVFMRNVITKAKVGDEALRRYQTGGEEALHDALVRRHGLQGSIDALINICRAYRTPFSLITFSRVIESDVLEVGEVSATLHFISGATIARALGQLSIPIFRESARFN